MAKDFARQGASILNPLNFGITGQTLYNTCNFMRGASQFYSGNLKGGLTTLFSPTKSPLNLNTPINRNIYNPSSNSYKNPPIGSPKSIKALTGSIGEGRTKTPVNLSNIDKTIKGLTNFGL